MATSNVEEVPNGNADWTAWRMRPPARQCLFGVDANMTHKFQPEPNAATLQTLIGEGAQHAHQERIRFGLGQPQAVAENPGVEGNAPVAQQPGGVPNLAGGGVAGLGGAGGNAQIAAVLQAPVLGDGGEGAAGEDARTLAITRDVNGNRFKEFREAVQDAKPCTSQTGRLPAQDLQVGGEPDAGSWWVSDRTSLGVQATTIRWRSSRARSMVKSPASHDNLRPVGRQQLGGIGGPSSPENRGVSQAQVGLGRRWRRGCSAYAKFRGITVSGIRVAKGSVDSEREAKNPGRKGFVKEECRQRGQRGQGKHSFPFAGLLQGFLQFFFMVFRMPTLANKP
eukprot:s443_g20.t1